MQTNAQLEFVQISNEVDWANVWSELGPMLDEHRQAWEMLYTKAYFAETVRNGDCSYGGFIVLRLERLFPLS